MLARRLPWQLRLTVSDRPREPSGCTSAQCLSLSNYQPSRILYSQSLMFNLFSSIISSYIVVIRLVNPNTIMQIIQVISTAEQGHSGNTSRKRTELMPKSYTSPLLEPLNSTDKRLSTQAPLRSKTLLHSFHGNYHLSN